MVLLSGSLPLFELCLCIVLVDMANKILPLSLWLLSTLSVKIVARTQNPLSSQDESTQMLRGEISHSNLHSVGWHSTEWRFEQRSCNTPIVLETYN